MTVHKVIVHEDYNRKYRFGSDLTLLQLDVPVDFNSHVRPACLPDNATVLPLNSSCWISGWGMLTEDGEFLEVDSKAKREGGLHGERNITLEQIRVTWCNTIVTK